jgi:N-acyl-L-homoserine lactone synthetase
MITLTSITDPTKLEEYHRFRYRIYSESEQKGLLESSDGLDRDSYDDTAVHLGWYQDGRLLGCVRFIHPIEGPHPLYCFTHMPEEATAPARELMRSYKDQGLSFVEVSRICIDPAHRDLATARDFVLATMACSHTLALDQALFTCFRPHAPFWVRLGFTLLQGAEDWVDPKVPVRHSTLVYRHADLPTHIVEQLPKYIAALRAKAK